MVFLNNFLFSYYPYIVLGVFLVGSIYRYEHNQYSWKSGSSQIFRKDLLFWGSNFFHFGIIILLLGHFIGLLTPKFIYSIFITPEHKQILAMYVGGISGFVAFIGINMLLIRRLSDIRVRVNSSQSDIIVLIIIYIQLLLGLGSIFVTSQHLDDSSSMLALASWVQGILIFDFNIASYIANEHWIFKLHLFFGMTFFLIFPFTRLVHIFSIPYLYLLRSGYQLVRRNVSKVN